MAERKCSNRPALRQGDFIEKGGLGLDLLLHAATSFSELLCWQYHFTLGRKGQLTELVLGFSDIDFHHLAGLHKLKDTHLARANRSSIFRDILSGRVSCNTVTNSTFFPTVERRIQALPSLAHLLDRDHLTFRYQENRQPHSRIESDFLLKLGNDCLLDISFLFLDQRDQGLYYARSFFPMEGTDYAANQMRYTLLKKAKRNLSTGECFVQYDRLTALPKK